MPSMKGRSSVISHLASGRTLAPHISRLRIVQVLVILVLCLGTLPLGSGLAAPLSQDPVINITFPSEGSTLSGQVEIRGTATHPNFNSYGVLYATGTRVTGDTTWKLDTPIAWDVRTMVGNGVLATWDTTQIANGQYVLALVLYEVGNETPMVHFINNLTILNEAATPTPEPTATPDPDQPGTAEATDEAAPPPPAPTIVQPPTATPRPTATIVAAAGSDTGGSGSGTGDGSLIPAGIFSIDAVKEAAKTGAQLAFLLYAVGILYVLAKAAIRYYLRQTKGKPNS